MAAERQRDKYFYKSPNRRLAKLLDQLGMSYEDAKFVLLVAEHDSFGGELQPDAFDDRKLNELLERLDIEARHRELVQRLAQSTDPKVRAAVDRVLDSNS